MSLNGIYDLVWDEKWWFPGNISGHKYGWQDLQNRAGSLIYLPQMWDIQWALLLGAVLVVVRYILERTVIAPLGVSLGVSRWRKPHVAHVPALEAAYMHVKHTYDYKRLSKQTDLTVKQVQVWFRDRKKQEGHTTLQKFCDSGWHFLFYVTSFTYGIIVMWNKPWFNKTIDCWVGWPMQNVTNDIYWYYMIELSFYWSLIFTLISDPKRTDFYQMLVHHVATIVLINFSWLVNFVRIGTLVLIVHDVADPLLELTKMMHYMKWKRATDYVFAVFGITWVISRHIIFPYAILYSTTFEILDVFGEPIFFNYFFNFFLYLLLALGFMWSYFLVKTVVKKFAVGELTDTRSDSESEENHTEKRRYIANGNPSINSKLNVANGNAIDGNKPGMTNGNPIANNNQNMTKNG